MFRESDEYHQLKAYSSNDTIINEKLLKLFKDKKAWHNLFRTQVVELIDEDIFRPLFCDGFGAPNASIRVLVGMFILKEARGMSDSQLFENCNFNILYKSALGLHNFDDLLPASSTYYLLRERIVKWEEEGHGNLLEQVFAQITRSQVKEFKIDGKKIRMDSKLLGSNIAWYNRYELVHETLYQAYRGLKVQFARVLSEVEFNFLKVTLGEAGKNVSYRSNKLELENKLTQLGSIIYKIISHIEGNTVKSIENLRKVFEQQYEVIGDTVIPLPKQQLKATCIQSPHDTDCHYKQKGNKQTKGYSINTTETCNPENNVNLITNVGVESASKTDNDHLIPAVEATQEILSQPIETLNTDGAYHSFPNENYCREKGIDHIIGTLTGNQARHNYSFNENNELEATNIHTNEVFPCIPVKTKNPDAIPKWRFYDDTGKRKYITQIDVDASMLRRQIKARTKEEVNLRNNVEATIFQLGYHYRGNKSRYRGLTKHRMWANLRCIWINFMRIRKYMVSLNPNTPNSLKEGINSIPIFDFLHHTFIKITFIIFLLPFRRNFRLTLSRFW